ncbi:MAG: ribonuclease H-like domain-containing protein [Candidatus Omnitrophota bacterium]|nr:ribonuclease H-like domain-containing protein [Candidatus Omnitrophota bacterium]
MAKIIFDVETVGQDFELLDDISKEYFLKYADTEEKKQEAKNSLSFYPLTAQIVAIGMLDSETDKGYVFFQNNSLKKEAFKEANIQFISGTEKEILNNFWKVLKDYTTVITFNGRVFDCPFVMLRSAILKIKPSKNLMPPRYGHLVHVDLQDQLSFYGAMYRKFSLHMWCKAFGIKSPKESGITGLDVKNLFKEGRYLDIARYCAGDLSATKELYGYWEKYIKF